MRRWRVYATVVILLSKDWEEMSCGSTGGGGAKDEPSDGADDEADI